MSDIESEFDRRAAIALRELANRPPPTGFAAKMAHYAAVRARLGRSPSPPPEPRYPVLISSSRGIITCPEQIQALAGLSETPTVETVQHTHRLASSGEKEPPVTDSTEMVQVCEIAQSKLCGMKRKFEIDYFHNGFVWIHGNHRAVAAVLGAKWVYIS
ncbi:hypothetical protein V2A60_009110 [Cordyceps javanica]